MSKKDPLDLPGFDRDPVTGRYFRKLPFGSPRNSDIRKHCAQAEENSSERVRTPNVVKLISQRKYGQLLNTKFETNVLESKAKDIHFNRQFKFTGNEGNEALITDSKLLKQGDGTIIGIWRRKDPPYRCYLGEFIDDVAVPFVTNVPLISLNSSKNTVCDFCECHCSPYRHVVFSINRNSDNMGLICLVNADNLADRGNFSSLNFLRLNTVSPIWCCTNNHQKQIFAVGLERFVNIYSTTSLLAAVSVPGKAHAVEFDKMGNIVLSGLNNGRLIMSDLRTQRKYDSSVKLSNYCIQQVKLSSGENYIIYGDFLGNIKRVDFRMNLNCVAEYKGHNGNKSYFSFSEMCNLLCANGQDHVTRLWSLERGGKPLKCIQTEQGSSSSAIISDNGSKCAIYHVVDDLINVYSF